MEPGSELVVGHGLIVFLDGKAFFSGIHEVLPVRRDAGTVVARPGVDDPSQVNRLGPVSLVVVADEQIGVTETFSKTTEQNVALIWSNEGFDRVTTVINLGAE